MIPVGEWKARLEADLRAVAEKTIIATRNGFALRDWIAREGYGATAIAVPLGIVISVMGFLVSAAVYDRIAVKDFERQAVHDVEIAEKALQNYSRMIDEAAALFSAESGRMDRWRFFEFSKTHLMRHPALKSIIWAPYLPASRLDAYKTAARTDGLFDFEFSEFALDGAVRPLSPRSNYLPAYFLEPFEGNERLLGVDLLSDPALASAIERALSERQADSTRGASILQARAGMVAVVQPVFAETPTVGGASVPVGAVVGAVDIEEAIVTAIDDYAPPVWVDLYVYAMDAAGDRLLAGIPSALRGENDRPPAILEDGGRAYRVEVDFAGYRVALVAAAVPGKFQGGSSIVPLGVALIGLLLTALLAQYLLGVRRSHRAMVRHVAERTAQLAKANQLNDALRQEVQHRMKVERDLREAKVQAEAASHAKSDFLAMVSHELRTPLNAIIGFSEVLSEEMFGPVGVRRYTEYAGDIRGSAQHLLELINSILDLTRVERDSYKLEDSQVDLVCIVDECVRMVADKARQSQLDLVVRNGRAVPIVLADETAMRQVVINLLQNAIKFTPPGGTVEIGARRGEAGTVELAVVDSGIGIAAGDLERVMEPFFQVESSLARQYEGVGLGLPLCRKLAKLHGGRLDLASAPGAGTTAIMRLPASRVVNVVRAAS